MNTTEVLFIGDQHIEARNGSEFFRKFFKGYLLDYILPYCKGHRIKTIISMGDVLDVRRSLIGEDMWWLVSEFIPMLADLGLEFLIVQGNHTQVRRDSNLVTWDAWLERESIAHGSHCIKAFTTPQDCTIGDTTFAMLPWVNGSSHDATVEYIKNTKATVALGHLELANFAMGSSLCQHGTLDAELLSKFDATYSGHFHNESSRGSIKYLGTPYDLNWGDYDDCTVKGVYRFNTLTQELTFVENPRGMSMFNVLTYDYEEIESKGLSKQYLDSEYLSNELGLKGSVIRVNVLNRDSSKHYKDFLTALKLVDCVNYTITDLTKQLDLVENKVDQKKWQLDPLSILLEKVDSTEGDNFNHEGVASKLKDVYTRCKENSNLVL